MNKTKLKERIAKLPLKYKSVLEHMVLQGEPAEVAAKAMGNTKREIQQLYLKALRLVRG